MSQLFSGKDIMSGGSGAKDCCRVEIWSKFLENSGKYSTFAEIMC